MQTNKTVYVVDGLRTPFLKARGIPGPFRASDLAVAAGNALLARQTFSPQKIDEVILGCVGPGPDEVNIARVVALRLGCGFHVPAWTVQRNCASGLQALDAAATAIKEGRAQLVLAGGTETMSHAPLLFKKAMAAWMGQWRLAKTFNAKLKVLTQLRLHYFAPVIGLLKGLTDPVVGLSMGQTAEALAYAFHISREAMDAYAWQSHQRLAKAYDNGWMQAEITPLFDKNGNVYERDDGLRRDPDTTKLKKLKPFFDKKFGAVTAGNSSQVTDGAAFLILASESAVAQYQLPVMGKIVDVNWAALDPSIMGLGPVHAMAPLLARQQLTLDDIDYFEINEAFAAQVLACQKVMLNETYCREQLGLASPLGKLPMDKLNCDGGAISLGHPVGASGTRLVLHLLHLLGREQKKRGIASLCIGGGQGGAMLLERITDKEATDNA